MALMTPKFRVSDMADWLPEGTHGSTPFHSRQMILILR